MQNLFTNAGAGCKQRILVMLLLLVAPVIHVDAVNAQSRTEEGWILDFDEDGIQVNRRVSSVSDVVEILALTTIDAPPEKVFAVITDYANYPSFMPHITESRIVAQEDNIQTLFQRVRISGFLSFLIKDRHHVVRNLLIYPDNGRDHFRVEWSLDLAATRELKPGNAIATRLNTGYWDLQGIDGEEGTQVLYYLHTDPGGSIPKSFVNAGTTKSIPAIIHAIRDRLAARE